MRRIIGSAGVLNPDDRIYVNIMETEGGQANSAGIVVIGSLPGLVPFFDEHTARRKAGYTLQEWRDLNWLDRAIEVAMFRIENKIEAILQEEAEAKKPKR